MKSTIGLLIVCLLSGTTWADDEAEVVTDVSVQTDKIISTTLRRYVQAYGTIEPQPASSRNAAASAKIAAPVAGIVSRSACEEGQAVTRGQVLFELDSRLADETLAKARIAVAFAEKNLARKQPLLANQNISRKLFDDAQQAVQTARQELHTAQTQRDLLTITAPLSGVLAICHVKVGEAVSASAVIAEVLNAQRLVVSLRVPSLEVRAVHLKQAVTLSTQSDDKTDAQSKIDFISPQIDPLNDTVLVRASLPAATWLRSGQFVKGRIVVEELPQRLAVPLISVVQQDGKSVIALVDGDTAKQREVTTGLQDGEWIEIQGDGLHEGMTVVTQGAYSLPPETRVHIGKQP